MATAVGTALVSCLDQRAAETVQHLKFRLSNQSLPRFFANAFGHAACNDGGDQQDEQRHEVLGI